MHSQNTFNFVSYNQSHYKVSDPDDKSKTYPVLTDKLIATLDEIMAALKSGQCAIVDIMTRIPLFSKGDVNKAEKKPLMDRVDSASKEITTTMKQLDRPAEAIKAINSFCHLRSHEPQESLTNIMLQFYKVTMNIIILACLWFDILGHGQCALKDITVGTERTSREIQGKQEWKVMFINTCKCPQQALVVSCPGFQTVEKVDPSLFAPVSGMSKCVVNGGRPIAPFGSVEFLYAWDPPFIFVPVSSQVHC
nr:TPD1 protein homolog 1B-like [Tanacetum cinerariifolium]